MVLVDGKDVHVLPPDLWYAVVVKGFVLFTFHVGSMQQKHDDYTKPLIP